MSIEDRVRRVLSSTISDGEAPSEAWSSILQRIRRRERVAAIRVRVVTSLLALALSTIAIAGLWIAFRPSQAIAPGGASQGAPVSRSPADSICSQSGSSGDFDGDGYVDRARLYAVVLVAQNNCGTRALESKWHFELEVALRSTSFTAPFPDCESLFDCQLLDGSDFDEDGRAELPVMLSMSASSVTAVYRVTEAGIEPIVLASPGDPGFLEPGPIRFGGAQDVLMNSGFECSVDTDGSRVVVAWSAERDDGFSPYRMHLSTLVLEGNTFRVTGTEDRADVTNLPPRHTICPWALEE